MSHAAASPSPEAAPQLYRISGFISVESAQTVAQRAMMRMFHQPLHQGTYELPLHQVQFDLVTHSPGKPELLTVLGRADEGAVLQVTPETEELSTDEYPGGVVRAWGTLALSGVTEWRAEHGISQAVFMASEFVDTEIWAKYDPMFGNFGFKEYILAPKP